MRDPEGLHRFLLTGSVTEYTSRSDFLAAVVPDFLVTFTTQEGLSFRDTPQDIVDTNGNYPFTMKGSMPYSFTAQDGITHHSGAVNPHDPADYFGDGPYAYTVTGHGIPLEFKFAGKINAFGSDIGDYNGYLLTQLEVDVMCPDGDLVLKPGISNGYDQFYGFVLDGDAAYEVNVNTLSSDPLGDRLFWDNIVGRFAPPPNPTGFPSESPSGSPTGIPSGSPTEGPTRSPTASPTTSPTSTPTVTLTQPPTSSPTVPMEMPDDKNCAGCGDPHVRMLPSV